MSSFILSSGLCSCSDKAPNTINAEENTGGKIQSFNLFPKDLLVYDNTGKLSLDQAFARSTQVIRTAEIKQIDHSNKRGVKDFYLYKVDRGKFEKSEERSKHKFPLLFLSEQQLFKGKRSQDSAYIFLVPLEQYKVLKKNINIQYKWLDEAPFLNR
ncbi:hypothetical protein GNY06_01005 [Elizabethkingia argentiflava]|uniref:Uncharacterized protein n=1 Tax=Elizabethkingia argenteiflava TaxID=2681556 RepID=A0A845PUS1_9FLAO|nr:hypothetical protein [Elizabethkingia argenteiflava]NAW50028.1 hypothetical protein [Elizabethkingia argenteiflava]